MNKATIFGRIGKDPELKYTPSGKAVCTYSVATSRRQKGKDEITTWHNIVAWEKTAEVMKEYLRKGQQVLIEGRIENRTYDKKDGTKGYISEIVADRFWFVGRPSESERAPDAPTSTHDDDDLPF